MRGWEQWSARRFLGAIVTVIVVMGSGMIEPLAALADIGVPGWARDLIDGLEATEGGDDPTGALTPSSESASPIEDAGIEPREEPDLPSAGTWQVSLNARATAVDQDVPVDLAAASDLAVGSAMEFEVLDDDAAETAGVTGFVFQVSADESTGASTSDASPDEEELAIEMVIDYSGFGDAYGAGYSDRLAVVALPECALDRPHPAGCQAGGVVVPARNDVEASELVAEVADLRALGSDGLSVGEQQDGAGVADAAPGTDASTPVAAWGGTAIFAVTSGASGATGNFAASPLPASGDWQVSPGSGEFSYGYPMAVPAPPAGGAPDIGLSYSSGAIDGLVSTRNTQAPQNGVGWSEFAGSFMERRYDSCVDTVGTGDLCWKNHNATISLNGRSSELVPLGTNYRHWRLKNDPGWLVERLTGANNGDQGTAGSNGDVGEYWKVTTPDGTQYFFGLEANPDTGGDTESTWTVPVLADHAGEPCRAANNTVGACNQAWRWNLDRVVDPNGMTTSYYYFKETNRYLTINGLGGDSALYTRAGRLRRIEYGKPAGTGPEVTGAARVLFDAEYRCAALTTCSTAPTKSNGTLFPDVPNDLICTSSCLVTTPTFFSGKRYTAVKTEVRAAGSWRPVDEFNLAHAHTANSDGDVDLYMTAIQRRGRIGGGTINLPAVNFQMTERPNRVDVNLAAGRKPMGRHRIDRIVDEYGSRTVVTYGQKYPCAANYSGPWDTNTRDCFRQKYRGKNAVFHKYLVTAVEERDPHGGSPTMTTSYEYQGTPFWHHDDDEFYPVADQTWSDWRGYGTTKITQSDSVTRVRVFRGMNNDLLSNGQYRQESVTSMLDPGVTFTDSPWLAGAVLEEASLGVLGDTLAATRHEYQTIGTAIPNPDPNDYATWVGESITTDFEARAVGVFAEKRTTTSYNSFFQPTTVVEEGWSHLTGDERCTSTSYANNTSSYLVVYPSSVKTVAGTDCGSPTATIVSQTETYYDNSSTLGAPPTKGRATRQRVRIDDNTWATTAEVTYDAFGRVLTVEDANGAVSSTAYEGTPNGGFPLVTISTNAAGHTTKTEWLPEIGAPLEVTDTNQRVTSQSFDELGRVVDVRQPTEQGSGPPSWEFSYQISPNKQIPPIVQSRQLQDSSANIYLDGWVIYDSFLRERQTQQLSPERDSSGDHQVVVTDTTYNDRGLVEDQAYPQAVTGTPGQGRLSVDVENKTRTSYDALGRVSREGYFRLNDSGTLTEAWTTLVNYPYDTASELFAIEATPPTGGSVRTFLDGLGRTVQVDEHDDTEWQSTTYSHDAADNLTSVTDPAGNTIQYTYNMAGWRVAMDDPDAGSWLYGYDPAGRQTTVVDGNADITHTSYDVLGRPAGRRRDGPNGPLLATWAYDAPGERGLLDSSTRHAAGGDWTVDVTGYDGRGRPTGQTWEVPAGVPGLSGSYTVGYNYDEADHVTEVAYPAIGGLAAETVTTRYDSLGLPEHMEGLEEYVWAAGYDSRARPSVLGFGSEADPVNQAFHYNRDQRVANMVGTTGTGSTTTVMQDQRLAYDRVGNVTQRNTVSLAGQSWRECFGHDARNRLTHAYTTAATGADDSCDAAEAGSGDQPYEHTYTYSPDGNLLSRTEDGTVNDYTYPAPGDDRPHAPTQVGSDSYSWDANGNLTARTVDGVTETFDWDAERQLSSVSGSNGTTTFVYDADGARLMRETSIGRTVTVAGHEISADLTGNFVAATRTYSFDGEIMATRSPEGVSYLFADHQGSVQASVKPGETAPEASQAYTPYGNKRTGGTGEFDTDRGWIGQIEDDTTSLSFLNARYYDAELGRFLSPDPLFDQSDPQTLNPYAYSSSNPVTFADPSGMMAMKFGKVAAKFTSRMVKRVVAAAVKVFRAAISYARTAIAAVQRIARSTATAVRGAARMVVAATQRQRGALTMIAMSRANPDPGFWKALGNAGGGSALVLHGLHAANPDPGFWRFVGGLKAECGSSCTGREVASKGRRIAESSRVNAVAIAFAGDPQGQGRRFRPVGLGEPPWQPIVDEFKCHWGNATKPFEGPKCPASPGVEEITGVIEGAARVGEITVKSCVNGVTGEALVAFVGGLGEGAGLARLAWAARISVNTTRATALHPLGFIALCVGGYVLGEHGPSW